MESAFTRAHLFPRKYHVTHPKDATRRVPRVLIWLRWPLGLHLTSKYPNMCLEYLQIHWKPLFGAQRSASTLLCPPLAAANLHVTPSAAAALTPSHFATSVKFRFTDNYHISSNSTAPPPKSRTKSRLGATLTRRLGPVWPCDIPVVGWTWKLERLNIQQTACHYNY